MTDQEIIAFAESYGVNMRPLRHGIEVLEGGMCKISYTRGATLHYAGEKVLAFAKALLGKQQEEK